LLACPPPAISLYAHVLILLIRLLPVFCPFFFQRIAAHRDLPSFPTRRSSDLGLVSMAMEVVWVRQYTPFLGTEVYAFANILATRSEEHTSELQSLTNLVCRLLLEKKKH